MTNPSAQTMLEPCPLCHGTAEYSEPYEGVRSAVYQIAKINCARCGLTIKRTTKSEVVAIWNVRAASAPAAVRHDELLKHWQRAADKVEHGMRARSGFDTRQSDIVKDGLANVREKTIAALATPEEASTPAVPPRKPMKLELSDEWCLSAADREAQGQLAPGCRSASSPCAHQKASPYTLCETCRPSLITVTIVIPSGYRDAADFLKDCQFEEASTAADLYAGTCEDRRLIAAGYKICSSNADRAWHWHAPGGRWNDGYKSESAAVNAALRHLVAIPASTAAGKVVAWRYISRRTGDHQFTEVASFARLLSEDGNHDVIPLYASPPAAQTDGVREAKALREFVGWIESWVSNPVGSYSVSALDGLFCTTRRKIAAISPSPQETTGS